MVSLQANWINPGMAVTAPEGIKRAKMDWTGTGTSIIGAQYPLPSSGWIPPQTNRQSDPGVSWKLRCLPFMKYKWTEQLFENSPVFIQRGFFDPLGNKAKEPNRVYGVGLPQLNFLLHQAKIADPNLSVEDVDAKWMYAGILLDHPQLPGTLGREREVNLTSRGDIFVINMWGSDVKGGDRVWFVIKEERIHNNTLYVTDREGMQLQTPIVPNGTPAPTWVPRIVPVITEENFVPVDKLRYGPGNRLGKPIYVGRVIRNKRFIPKGPPDTADSLGTRMPVMMGLDVIEVFVGAR
jgi:hypothetical protein